MAQFRIELAGYTGQIDSLFESTRDYCRKYLTEADADFAVTVSREDLVFVLPVRTVLKYKLRGAKYDV